MSVPRSSSRECRRVRPRPRARLHATWRFSHARRSHLRPRTPSVCLLPEDRPRSPRRHASPQKHVAGIHTLDPAGDASVRGTTGRTLFPTNDSKRPHRGIVATCCVVERTLHPSDVKFSMDHHIFRSSVPTYEHVLRKPCRVSKKR